jgi:hypothetical protein
MTHQQRLERINLVTKQIKDLKRRGLGDSPLRQELFEELVGLLRAVDLNFKKEKKHNDR